MKSYGTSYIYANIIIFYKFKKCITNDEMYKWNSNLFGIYTKAKKFDFF